VQSCPPLKPMIKCASNNLPHSTAPQFGEWIPHTPRPSNAPWDIAMRYVRTIRHLEPIQIYSRVCPRVALPHTAVPAKLRPGSGPWAEPILRRTSQTAANRFRFLNEEREIRTWNENAFPKLWLYNLHYFEYVDLPLVERWIDENDVGRGVGWEPYPTSLRIANWCKWLLNGGHGTAKMYESLAMQAAWLERRVERHLLANHVLANAKALLFAGTALECSASHRWQTIARDVLEEELPRQILSDGAHVERSPMYHSIVLEDLLDIANLNNAYHLHLPQLSSCIPRMLRWLQHMTHPDGEIALFNDACIGIAPNPCVLLEYAARLGFEPAALLLGDSGYVRLENSNSAVIVDAGVLGPDYQPGHGHSDTLSFELSHRRKRLIVNSGTSTYEADSVRAFERSTAAHNTVRVDHLDQSELWAVFRVARRARPYGLQTDHETFVEAAHDGYHRLRPKVTHRRRLVLLADSLTITDQLEGYGEHNVEVFFHLAPGAEPELLLDPKLDYSIEPCCYSVGWNSRLLNRVIIGTWRGTCPVEFVSHVRLP